MQIGYETVRANLITKVEALKGKNADLDAVIDKYLETKNNTKANDAPAKALIAALEACGCDESKEILKDKQYLAKKSFWIFGGDGWAYDIGLRRPGSRSGFRPRRQCYGLRYRDVLQHRRTGFQGLQHR